MDILTDVFGPLTVTQRAVIGIVVAILIFAVLIGMTRLVTSWGRALLIWFALLLALVSAVLLVPIDTDDLMANARPAADYQAAVARFEAERQQITEPLNPLCEPQLLTHGAKVERVVVLMHGVSSCPRAFVDFAPILYERGYNVLTVLMPQNGFADRSTNALGNLTAEQLRDMGDTSVDIAAGLGEEVVVLGISAGGTVAAWAAQNRPEVDRAVLVAPFFGLAGFGPTMNLAFTRVMLVLPSISIWKDPILRDRYAGMPHAYQRQSTRATGEIMRLGLATYRQASEYLPAAAGIAVVTNEADTAVSNSVTHLMVERWVESGAAVSTFEFVADHELGHELIDPLEPGADPKLTYPVILQMIEDPRALEAIPRG